MAARSSPAPLAVTRALPTLTTRRLAWAMRLGLFIIGNGLGKIGLTMGHRGLYGSLLFPFRGFRRPGAVQFVHDGEIQGPTPLAADGGDREVGPCVATGLAVGGQKLGNA